MTYLVKHFINGQLIETSEQRKNIYNPASGEIIGQVQMANIDTITQTVAAAKKAYQTWSQVTPLRRARFLFNYKLLLEKNINELAALITREHGKTLSDASASIQRGIDVVEFACGIPGYLKGIYTEQVAKNIDSYSIRQPVGVCAGITPFNFPAMIPLWMFPLAIGCGNTFILKPSEKDPSCSIRLMELAKEAGIPDGVVNVVQGDKEAVDALLTHRDIQTISFVGSTPVAQYVQRKAIESGKRVQAFGGAKNHCIIMPDADIEQTANAILGAAYGSAGERCMAISVVVAVGNTTADQLVAHIAPKINQLKIGPGTDPNIEMGPLITAEHHQKVLSYIDLGIKENAKLIVDGRSYKTDATNRGFYLGASLFDHVKPSMRIYREEIFGPVLCVVRVNHLEEAIQLINDHEYGNGTAIFTRDGYSARTFANQIQAGMVGINIAIPVPVAYHSFGGWKHSIFADIGMHGEEGIRFYTKLKTVTQRWPKAEIDLSNFSIPTH